MPWRWASQIFRWISTPPFLWYEPPVPPLTNLKSLVRISTHTAVSITLKPLIGFGFVKNVWCICTHAWNEKNAVFCWNPIIIYLFKHPPIIKTLRTQRIYPFFSPFSFDVTQIIPSWLQHWLFRQELHAHSPNLNMFQNMKLQQSYKFIQGLLDVAIESLKAGWWRWQPWICKVDSVVVVEVLRYIFDIRRRPW
jgi:hypothetical protein